MTVIADLKAPDSAAPQSPGPLPPTSGSAIPEPATYAFMVSGLVLGVAVSMRRRNTQAAKGVLVK